MSVEPSDLRSWRGLTDALRGVPTTAVSERGGVYISADLLCSYGQANAVDLAGTDPTFSGLS